MNAHADRAPQLKVSVRWLPLIVKSKVEGLMGTAGLDVNRLAGLLRRIEVDCTLVEGDESQDHCVLRLSSVKRPGQVAFVEYVNQGVEPRLAGIKMEPPDQEDQGAIGSSFWITEEWINLRGSRRDDPQKIAEMVEQVFST